LVWKIMKIHVEQGPFFMGTVTNAPTVVVAKTELRNVPNQKNLMQGGLTGPWGHPTPAVYDPELFFWQNPTAHKA
jgi:peptide/nickel transport system substrate-binding protein